MYLGKSAASCAELLKSTVLGVSTLQQFRVKLPFVMANKQSLTKKITNRKHSSRYVDHQNHQNSTCKKRSIYHKIDIK